MSEEKIDIEKLIVSNAKAIQALSEAITTEIAVALGNQKIGDLAGFPLF